MKNKAKTSDADATDATDTKRRTLNWCYGARAPVQHMDQVEQQMLLAHRYRNRLTELELERRRRAEDFAATLHPEFAGAIDAYRKADQRVDRAYEDLRKTRARARKRVDPTPQQASAIADAKQARSEAYQQMKACKKEAYQAVRDVQQPYLAVAESQLAEELGDALDAMKPATRKRTIRQRYNELLLQAELDDGGIWHAEQQRLARGECGCHWGTYLTVEDAAKDFGTGAPPRFKRFDGNNSIAVQLQGGLSVEDAVAGTDTRLRLELPPLSERMATKGKDHGRGATGYALLRIGSDGRQPIFAKIPFTYHRPLPDDGVIKWAYLDRRRIAGQDLWKLRLCLQTGACRKYPDDDSMVAVHIGYRHTPDGMRVATMVDGMGEQSTFCLDMETLSRPSKSYDLESIRDSVSEMVYDGLRSWLQSTERWPWLDESFANIAHWRGPERIAALVEQWRDHRHRSDGDDPAKCFGDLLVWATDKLADYRRKPHYRPKHPDDLSTVFGLLNFWRRWDKHMRIWSARQSVKYSAHRDDVYRNFAVNLRRRYGWCALARVDWKSLGKRPDATDTIDAATTTAQRRLSRAVAPGRLSEILKEVFGERCLIVSSVNLSRECANCATVLPSTDAVSRQCRQCGATWDRDDNGAAIQLARGEALRQGQVDKKLGKMQTELGEEPTARKVRRNRRTLQDER